MLKVNDEEIEFTIDTGAEVSVLNTNVAKNLGLNIMKPAKVLVGADGSKLNVRVKACVYSFWRIEVSKFTHRHVTLTNL
ncbi:hypothetical protein EB796_008063 [Bugula neritina]|uniref:Peptidase A2 domain-containing protein n=1 Tax=Bugula neritina TaxID=10212 RepID=A0A7J7K4R0_BUGNE|nr:hypothetical protein EB796_008063 [Bugula neritina]